MEITQKQIEEHILKVETGHIEDDWSVYGRCRECLCLAVEIITKDERPQYNCRVCKAQYSQ